MSKLPLNFNSMKKRFVLMIALSTLVSAFSNPSWAQAQSEPEKSKTDKSNGVSGGKNHKSSQEKNANRKSLDKDSIVRKVGADSDSKNGKLEELSLDDMMDTAILLRFISEQSINIYEEAARIPVGQNASANYKPPETIPVASKVSKFLPPRQEWLVFYLGIMEPVIRELAKEASDIEAGSKQLVIPKSMEETLTPLWEDWSANTKAMNRHLDELVPMFDDTPPDNVAIQNKAVEIYENVKQLEKIRKDLFNFMKANIKSGDKEKIMITPDK